MNLFVWTVTLLVTLQKQHTILANLRQNKWEFIPPPPPPEIKDGKILRFGFCMPSALIWGDVGLLFHLILSKLV